MNAYSLQFLKNFKFRLQKVQGKFIGKGHKVKSEGLACPTPGVVVLIKKLDESDVGN